MKKLFLLALITPAILVFQFVQPPSLYAAKKCSQGLSQAECSACSGISELGTGQNCQSKGSTLKSVIKTVVSVLSLLLGAIAVIMIIISGFRFVISGGGSNGVAAAKGTLIWALVGLAIALLAQAIVTWVIGTSAKVVSYSALMLSHYLH
ncbi:pilin [Patescibacteria group bacterium]|jgi:hypothetical protein|nr:pilin [Patescibacteria group bacterium]